MKLHTRISIGLAAGAIVGVAANVYAGATDSTIADSVAQLQPFGDAWIRAITAIVIPLVVASLVVGAASLGDLRTLGRMGGKTVVYYMTTTAIAVTIGLVLSNIIKPDRGSRNSRSRRCWPATAPTRRAVSSWLGRPRASARCCST
ncbi:MAG: cation:dicarboxylase symporter family transporter [Gemmatimonadales bacterium]